MPTVVANSNTHPRTTAIDDSDTEEAIAKGAVEGRKKPSDHCLCISLLVGAIEKTHEEDSKRTWRGIGIFVAIAVLLVIAYFGYTKWYKPMQVMCEFVHL